MSSSSDLAISVRGLSKSYRITQRQEHAANAGSRLGRFWNTVAQRHRAETFWALNDVSFDVSKGDVIGIIGRNGAGKSTLLKILSGITSPTLGEARIYGRVGSLLEVGTGFHPELTGRENIYLNGTILGMRRTEITRQFDAIVDFAGIQRFLDTPVKRYSSGMYVRLAFAVAAHLEPEILIVDEVLAVGDAEFQRKCLGKMQEVAREGGRTILFVSHNMAAVQTLCSSGIYLDSGSLICRGEVEACKQAYMLRGPERAASIDLTRHTDRTGTGLARITRVVLMDVSGRRLSAVRPKQPFIVRLEFQATQPLSRLMSSVDLETADSVRIATLWSGFRNEMFQVPAGANSIECLVEGLSIRPDRYCLNIGIGDEVQTHDLVRRAVELNITLSEPGDVYGTEKIPRSEHGPMLVGFRWRSGTSEQFNGGIN